jgi:Flp pilus assembly pilin Flp
MSTKMRALLQMLAADRKGATAIEYGLITGLIALVIAGNFKTIGILIYIIFAQIYIAFSPLILNE